MNMQKLHFLSSVLLFAVGCQKVPHIEYTIEQFMETTSIRGSSFSHDEKEILFSSDATGIYNAYTVAVDGGTPKALTQNTTNSILIISIQKRFFYN